MFDVDRILAIPDESVDYLQMGISGGERAALAARGFVRKDGTKAKDYMIRTIQKTEKNKAKAEKAIIKGDKPLPIGVLNAFHDHVMEKYPNTFKRLLQNNSDYKTFETEYNPVIRLMNDVRSGKADLNLLESAFSEIEGMRQTTKASKSSSKIAPDTAKKIAVTYNKKGDLSEGAAAKKIKAVIAGQAKGGKVVKGMSPRDRASFISKSLQNTLGENNFLVKNKHEGVKLIEDAIKNNRGNLEADSMGKLQVLKINKPSKKYPHGSASVVVDNSSLGKGAGKERSTVDLVYLADNARKLAKKKDSVSPMERLEQLIKLGNESKPNQPSSAAQKMNMTDAEYAAFKKKVKRL